jgi:hypothetical protein
MGQALRCATLALFLGVVLVECGVQPINQSQSVSVSSSVSKGKPIKEEKKSSRVGKVLYTAPYSTVRLTKNEGKSLFPSSGPSSKFRSTGPVLIKKGEEVPTTTTTTTTTPTPVQVVLIDTEPAVTDKQVTDSTTTTLDVIFS